MGQSHFLLVLSLLFSRFFGLFVLSPLFPKAIVPYSLRLLLVFVSLSLLSPLFLSQIEILEKNLPVLLLQNIKELGFGYLLGFVLSILFEALAFAGELLTSLGGLSAVSLFTNTEGSTSSLSKLFSLFGLILFFALDWHHFLLRFLYKSFSFFPLSPVSIDRTMVFSLIQATGLIFYYGFTYAFFPFLILLGILTLLGLLSRDFMIFIHAFPLQLLATLIAVFMAASFFVKIFHENLDTLILIAKKALFQI